MNFHSRFLLVTLAALLVIGTGAMAAGFNIEQQFDAQMLAASTADLDNDNYVDLVWTSPAGAPGGMYLGTWIAYGQSDGLFTNPVLLNAYNTAPMIIDYADDDEYLDIIVITSDASTEELIVYHNNGDRTFSQTFSTAVSSSIIPTIAAGFFNNDAKLDVILGDGSVYVGDGLGSFSKLAATGLLDRFEAIDVADFNHDGIDDIVAYRNMQAGVDDSIATYLNDGNGLFTRADAVVMLGGANEVTTDGGWADFNRDGNVDFAFGLAIGGYPYSSLVIVGFTDEAGMIQLDTVSLSEGYFKDVLAADVNRDNKLDLVTSNASNIPVARMVVYYGDGNGNFNDSMAVPYGGSPGINLALASGDFNRDGNPDFVSAGSFQDASPLTILYDDELKKEIRPWKMTVTSLSDADIQVVNPDEFVISREFRTVAGSEYRRRDFNDDNKLDRRTVDYNLQDGDYCICVVPNSGMQAGEKVTVQTEIESGRTATLFLNYELGQQQVNDVGAAEDTLKFYYNASTASAIMPRNGIPTGATQPLFEWVKVLPTDIIPVSYDFQLDEDFYFGSPRIDETGLASPHYLPSTDLGADSVYYWRYRTWDGAAYSDYSPTYAAYVTPDCCAGVRGNVNSDPSDAINISDVTFLVDFLFGSPAGETPVCTQEANVNGDPDQKVNISDLTYLVAFLFDSPNGPEPPACQ